MKLRRSMPALALIFALSSLLLAQAPARAFDNPKFDISVTDAAGAPLVGAKVTMVAAAEGWKPKPNATPYKAETNKKGLVVFGFAKADDYVITVDAGQGLQPVKVSVKMRDQKRKPVVTQGKTVEDREGAVDPANPIVPLSVPNEANTVQVVIAMGPPPAQQQAAGQPGSIDVQDAALKQQLRAAVEAIQANNFDLGLTTVDGLLQKRDAMKPEDLASVLYMRAFCLYQLKRETEAEPALTEALKLRPDLVPALDLLGPIYVHQKRYAEAQDVFQKDVAQTEDPAKKSQLLLNLGLVLREQGKDADAVAPFEQAKQLAPDDPNVIVQLADLYTAMGRGQDAEQLMGGSNLPPDQAAVLRFNMAVAFMKAKKWAEADAQFRKCIELNPQMPEAHRYLAECLLRTGKRAEAVTELEEYLKLAPNAPDAETVKTDIKNIQIDLKQPAQPAAKPKPQAPKK